MGPCASTRASLNVCICVSVCHVSVCEHVCVCVVCCLLSDDDCLLSAFSYLLSVVCFLLSAF
jgi:hypothetical protein